MNDQEVVNLLKSLLPTQDPSLYDDADAAWIHCFTALHPTGNSCEVDHDEIDWELLDSDMLRLMGTIHDLKKAYMTLRGNICARLHRMEHQIAHHTTESLPLYQQDPSNATADTVGSREDGFPN